MTVDIVLFMRERDLLETAWKRLMCRPAEYRERHFGLAMAGGKGAKPLSELGSGIMTVNPKDGDFLGALMVELRKMENPQGTRLAAHVEECYHCGLTHEEQ